jgi:hypothetical protein
MGKNVDNILKILLSVLGVAGIITFLATALNTPTEPTPTEVASDATPVKPANEKDADEPTGGDVVVDEDDVTAEDLESFGDPSVELPGDEPEEDAPVNLTQNGDEEAAPASNDLPLPPPIQN